ncbi:MAG: VOC family protein [Thermoleophilia bacterium]|nr:VOC family protein [Thermoleophilia bacterium]
MTRVTSVYPVLMVDDVPAAVAFFRDHLGFGTTFESDWYVSLARPEGHELAVLQADHPTVPDTHRGARAAGSLLNVEVEDVDAEFARMVGDAGLEPVRDLRSEDFGQRHFIVRGPEGVLVDVITPIPPAAHFAEAFAAGGA